MLCKETCRHFSSIANTNTTGKGICMYCDSYNPVDLGSECPFAIVESGYKITCADCERFGTDYACFTAKETDDATNCSGFIDKREELIKLQVLKLVQQGRYDRDKLIKVIDDCVKEFMEKAPNSSECETHNTEEYQSGRTGAVPKTVGP